MTKLEQIEELEKEIRRLKANTNIEEIIPSYSFSKMTDAKLKKCVAIH